jgi:hypothetical protein
MRLQFASQQGSYLGAVEMDEILEEFVHEGAAEALLAAPPTAHRSVTHSRRSQDL